MSDTFVQLAVILRNMPDAVWEIAPPDTEYCPDSWVARELAQCSEPQFKTLESVYSQARIAVLFVAADHMRAIARGITPKPLTYAPWASARCVLEACSLSCWLADKKIEDTAERVARSLNLRLSIVKESAKRMYSTKGFSVEISDSDIEQQKRRVDDLKAEADAFGIDWKCDKKGQVTKFGNRGLPSRTDLSKDIFNAEYEYRILSMATHADDLLLDMSTQISGGEAPLGYELINQHLSEENAQFIAVNTVDWFARAVWELFVTHGWQTRSLAKVLENTYDRLEAICNGSENEVKH